MNHLVPKDNNEQKIVLNNVSRGRPTYNENLNLIARPDVCIHRVLPPWGVAVLTIALSVLIILCNMIPSQLAGWKLAVTKSATSVQ